MIFKSSNNSFGIKPIREECLNTDSLVASVGDLCKSFCEELKIFEGPEFVLEMTLTEGKLEDFKKKFMNFCKEIKKRIIALIDLGWRKLNEVFNDRRKFVEANKEKIIQNAAHMKDTVFDTYVFRIEEAYTNIEEVLTEIDYMDMGLLLQNLDGNPKYQKIVCDDGENVIYVYDDTISKDLIAKMIGVQKYDSSTFVKDAKNFIMYDKKNRTLAELGGIDAILREYGDSYKFKDKLKQWKKKIQSYKDEFDNSYFTIADSQGKEFVNMKYSDYSLIYADISFISNRVIEFMNICINMAQMEINQYTSILKKIASYKIAQEMTTTPIGSMII